MTRSAEAQSAGVAYLSYILFAMSSSVLFAHATAGDTLSQSLGTLSHLIWTARVTVLLDLLQTVCALVLAATLYQLVRSVSPTLALLAMLFRLGEGLLGFLPLLSKLDLMHAATASPADALADPGVLARAADAWHRSAGGFSEFCFVVGGFLFAWLFLRGRLVPRWLAWIGVLTIGVQLICVPLQVAMILPRSLVNWLWLPILLYEVPLGFWLLLKGTARAPFDGSATA